MGISYSVYVLPRENDVRPTPEVVVRLIEALQAARYLARPGDPCLATITNKAARESGAVYLKLDEWNKWKARALTPPPKPSWRERILGIAPKREVPRLYRPPFTIPPTPEAWQAMSGAVQIEWPIEDAKKMMIEYPFDMPPANDMAQECTMQMLFSDDFNNVCPNPYMSSAKLESICSCGIELGYEADNFGSKHNIRRLCPECGAAFKPQERTLATQDGCTGKPLEIRGGVCFRFAISIECGRNVPHQDTAAEDVLPSLRFMRLCEHALGLELYAVGAYS